MHIPRPFTPERPPLHFTKEHFDIPMSEHPEAKDLPEAGDAPAMFPSARHYAPLALGPGAPRKLDDYLYSDLPQFALHVVTFEDGTLVSINFSHMSSDVSGLRYILDAWQLHLAGKPEEKAKFMSISDGMAPLFETPSPERHVIADVKLSGWRMMAWALRFMWDSWWIPYESRLVSVPKPVIDKLVQNARNDLAKTVPDGQDAPFVTEGDVLLALGVQMAAYNLPEGSTRSISELIAVNPRGRSKVFRADSAYVQNAPSGVLITCPAQQALAMNLGKLALHMRKAIARQTTEEQLKASAAVLADTMKKTGKLPMYGDVTGLLSTSSNWSRAKLLLSIDFSPAVIKPSKAPRSEGSTWKPGHPVYYHSRNFEGKGALSTSVLIIMGRDHEGNMWLTGDYPDWTWSRLMETLNSQ